MLAVLEFIIIILFLLIAGDLSTQSDTLECMKYSEKLEKCREILLEIETGK